MNTRKILSLENFRYHFRFRKFGRRVREGVGCCFLSQREEIALSLFLERRREREDVEKPMFLVLGFIALLALTTRTAP
ncbi:MAG: hypothetical protein DRN91_03555 [Candidatus Alkanophagales archaeon]|nr:MAG: hypothetical protein DRN91_03555 [Candidatus Alkanophagales archaeon]